MNGRVFQAVDLFDLIRVLLRKRNAHQKAFLDKLENIVSKDSTEFRLIRKLFLDHSNDYYREMLLQIFGADFEGMLE